MGTAFLAFFIFLTWKLIPDPTRFQAVSLKPPKFAQKWGQTQINPRDGAVMVWIPGGLTQIGLTSAQKEQIDSLVSQKGAGYSKSSKLRYVHVEGFWLYASEVTVGQFRKFCFATRTAMPDLPENMTDDTQPMVNVSAKLATAYAKWALSIDEANGLPTEVQWERAARYPKGGLFPWGNEWKAGNLLHSVPPQKAECPYPINSFPDGASTSSIFDLAGNVREWCTDAEGKRFMLRGGSWKGASPESFFTTRIEDVPVGHFDTETGFRCAAR